MYRNLFWKIYNFPPIKPVSLRRPLCFYGIAKARQNMRNVQTYWILERAAEECRTRDFYRDAIFQKTMLMYSGRLTYELIRHLDNIVAESVFVLLCDLYWKYDAHKIKGGLYLRQLRKSLLVCDYSLGQKVCRYL